MLTSNSTSAQILILLWHNDGPSILKTVSLAAFWISNLGMRIDQLKRQKIVHFNCQDICLDDFWYFELSINNLLKSLKCIWHEIIYLLIRKSFQSDEEWWLFYCNSSLACRVIQDIGSCKLEDLWHHNVDTKLCKITKYRIHLCKYSSLQGWNFAELMCTKNYTSWWWLWCHHSNILVTRPLPLFVSPESNGLSCVCVV